MSLSRFNAIDTLFNRSEFDIVAMSEDPTGKITEYFGTNVFGDDAMQRYLPEVAYLNVKAAIQSGSKLTREVADIVADAMKKWAIDKGATHYAHWF
ncbi:MAG: glutamine synthetase III, partial [Saprospiraceae bacterium]